MATYEFGMDPRNFESRRDYVKAIYEQQLGREADYEGLNYWIEQRNLQGNDLIRQMRESAGLDNTLFQDPAYAAFERQRMQQDGTIEADRLARLREIDAQRQLAGATYDRNLQIGLENVDDKAEARGMYRSGGRTKSRQELATAIANERGAAELQSSSQAADVNRAAAADRAELSRQRDEQEVATRNRLTQKSIQGAV